MSKSQLNVYFEWNGVGIKAKKHKVLQRYLQKDISAVLNPALIDYKIEHFKDVYVIGTFSKSGNKLISYTRNTEDLPDVLQSKYKYILCEIKEDSIEPVIANHTKAGKPRMYLIKGQDIYSGNLREHMRGFVMDKIKECYYPFIKDLKPIDFYPVKIRCEVHDTIKNNYAKDKDEFGGRWDIDNLVYPYLKAFPDLLVREKILKDDDRLHLPSSIHAEFVPIDNHEERKLVFIIEKDEREVLKNNTLFQRFHKESFESEDTELVKDDLEIKEIDFTTAIQQGVKPEVILNKIINKNE